MGGTPYAGSPLALYDELVLQGRAPDLVPFCADFPQHGDLARRINALESARPKSRFGGGPPQEPCSVGGFRLLGMIAQGGMGQIFLAEQTSSGRRAAVKLVGPDSSMSIERFRREAELAALLAHPSVAAVYAFGLEERVAYLATELIHGISLCDALAPAVEAGHRVRWAAAVLETIGGKSLAVPGCRLAPALAAMVGLASGVAEGLAHAHARGVVHRDIKPSNLMFTIDGRAKVIDFGLAIPMGEGGDRMTRPGAFLGSPRYAAPEQLRGDHAAVGPWTDTFALGATLFELVTGEPPFASASISERRALPDAAAPRRPSQLDPEVPAELDAVVMRALDPVPGRRYQQGGELLRALASL